jgi:hypothetical protein
VVLRRRLSVLLMALMVVVALGIGLLGAVSASSADDDEHSDKGRTLTVLAKIREGKVVDVGPPGPSQGDMRVVNSSLYDATGKEKVGRHDQFCVLTDPGEKAQMTECMRTYTLPGGEINSEGVSARSTLSEPQNPGGTDAISGGTGEYAGVRGEVRFGFRGNKVISTFHFID